MPFATLRSPAELPSESRMNLKQLIRSVPDFPKPGILFRDVTPLLQNPAAFREVVHGLAKPFRDERIDVIVAAEARGFLFAAPLALELNAALVPIRKPGKLPYEAHTYQYDLEYGTDTLQMHTDAVKTGDRVLLVDDLLATGGTMQACLKMVALSGGTIVGCAFAIELEALKGRDRLSPHPVFSLIRFAADEP